MSDRTNVKARITLTMTLNQPSDLKSGIEPASDNEWVGQIVDQLQAHFEGQEMSALRTSGVESVLGKMGEIKVARLRVDIGESQYRFKLSS